MRFSCALITAALLSAPVQAASPVADNPYPALRIMDQRVAAISYRLTQANADWCAETEPKSGVTLANLNDYPAKNQALARKAYDIDPAVKDWFVLDVVAGTAAEQSKVRVGQSAERLNIRATDAVKTHCIARISVAARDDMYAATDGKRVQISAALIARTRDDDELAALLAHELSHVILEHPARLKGKRSIARIKQTERDADRLSVWLMARAGYDPVAAVRFWTHYGPSRNKGIFNAPTHENWKERVARLTSEIASMQKARAANRDAMPIMIGLKRHDR
jgi:beta-barrel assembly-enhancing protease